MANEPIESLTDPGRSEPRSGSLACEYCGTQLTQKGEAIKLSDRARELRTAEDRLTAEQAAHANTRGELAAAQTRIGELEAQVRALSPAPEAPRASDWGMR